MKKWTRRGFIVAGVLTGGTLAVGVAIRPGHRAPKLAQYVTEGDEVLVNAWVKVAPDNTITAIVPHCEMGQGVRTSLGMMLAEEMDANWDRVEVEEAPATKEYANHFIPQEFLAGGLEVPGFIQGTIDGIFMLMARNLTYQITGGSMSVRFTGRAGMQVAGAAARQMLLDAAAATWQVPAASLRTDNSFIYHDPSGKVAPYAEFAARAGSNPPPTRPKLKSPKDYKIMGKSIPRIDLPEKVTGQAKFGIDIHLPDMKYAAVKASPVLGNIVKTVDTKAALNMPGVLKILDMGTYVAVVASTYWQAKTALEAVNVEFSANESDLMSQQDIYTQFRRDMSAAISDSNEKEDVVLGDIDAAMKEAAETFEAEYQVPYLAHATMEPMNATANFQDGVCHVWSGMQDPLATRYACAEALGLGYEDVRTHNQLLGGGFGRRYYPDVAIQAAQVAQKTGLAVKVVWSREEDISQDFYRPACISRFRAGLDKGGVPIAWENQFVDKHDPVEASHIPYAIKNQYIHYTDSPTHVRFGAWRSVDHSQHTFFTESFIDELAHKSGQNGYEFRRSLLSSAPRFQAVLDEAAALGNWGHPSPAGIGRGIAIAESFQTIVAQVIEVDLREGTPKVTNVSVAADPGFAVNPDGFVAQMESGVIFGLTAALYGEISINNGAVEQSNFHDYEMIRMDTAPNIQVSILNSGTIMGGAGEPGTPPVAPALANAIFAASGKRIRQLPVKNFIFN